MQEHTSADVCSCKCGKQSAVTESGVYVYMSRKAGRADGRNECKTHSELPYAELTDQLIQRMCLTGQFIGN